MRINIFDDITIIADTEEVYMMLWVHHEMLKRSTQEEKQKQEEVTEMEPAAEAKAAEQDSKLQPAQKQKKTPAKTKDVDWGKARALRKAGWSYEKIGDELGISGVTVSAHLRGRES